MIGIRLDGQDEFLQLNPDTSIQVTLENPLLGGADKISPGSYSYPFTIPVGEASPINTRLLKNPDVIENNELYQVQRATLFFAGVPWRTGNLKPQSTAGNNVSANFLWGLSQVSDDFKTARLRDVIAEQITIDDTAIVKKIYLKRTTSGDYNVTINGKNYTAGSISGLRTAINTDADATLDTGQYMPYATEISSGTSPSGLISSTFLEIKLSLYYTFYDDILEMEFWLRADNNDPNAELWITTDEPTAYQVEAFDMTGYYNAFSTFLAGYYNGTYPTAKIRFPVCFNATPYGDLQLKESEIINARNTSGIVVNDANWGLNNAAPFQVKNYNSIQPFLRIKWILEKIATTFNFEIEGDFYALADVANMLLDNSFALDLPLKFIGDKQFVFWRRAFNLNDLTPDISVVEFIAALQSRYNLGVYYNETTRKLIMQLREPIAKSYEYNDVTAAAGPIKNTDDNRITGITIKSPKEDTDAISFDESITSGTPEKEVVLKLGAIRNSYIAVIDGVTMIGPRVSRKFGDRFGLRVFYYKGLTSGGGGFDYPAADIDGTEIYESLNDFILREGIFTKFHRYWILHETNRRLVKLNINYHLRELLDIPWTEKVRFNRNNYLLKSIRITFTNAGITQPECELITLQ